MKKGIEVHRWSKKTECKKEILILYHNSWKLSPDQGISILHIPDSVKPSEKNSTFFGNTVSHLIQKVLLQSFVIMKKLLDSALISRRNTH